jgi:hypothetical protein
LGKHEIGYWDSSEILSLCVFVCLLGVLGRSDLLARGKP